MVRAMHSRLARNGPGHKPATRRSRGRGPVNRPPAPRGSKVPVLRSALPWPVRASASGGLPLTEARAKGRRRALEASGILRCQWPFKAEGQDDVDETADGLWRAREDASWEALLLRLETSFAAIETEHSRQWRRVLARQKHRECRLQATLEAVPSRVPLRLRRLWWWLRLRSHCPLEYYHGNWVLDPTWSKRIPDSTSNLR